MIVSTITATFSATLLQHFDIIVSHSSESSVRLSDERPRMPSRCCKRVAEKATMTVNTVDTVWSELPDEKGRARVV